MRSADLRRQRAARPTTEPARPGSALLRARGAVRRSARTVTSFVMVTSAGLASRAGFVQLPTTPNRREQRPRG